MKKWREDVNKVYHIHGSKSSSPEYEQLLIADHLLERAYAHDPLVMAWFDTRGYAIEDLEMEIERLKRLLEGKRVGAPIIDISKMREDIAEKERHLIPLTELELILEGAQKKQVWAEEKMKEKGFATIDELENEVDRLRGIVADPIEPRVAESQLLEEELPPKRWKRVPEVEYEIPVLPVEELKEPERTLMIGWLSAMLDAEGSLYEGLDVVDRVKKIDRWLYKYEYTIPVVQFANYNYELVKKWCNLVGRKVPERKLTPYEYKPDIGRARAIAYLILTRPYLIRLKDKAEEFLKKYRERSGIKYVYA